VAAGENGKKEWRGISRRVGALWREFDMQLKPVWIDKRRRVQDNTI